mgnify:FL=1
MSKQLLLGDEAIAQAALDAGLSGVYAYPGTPSTEITEYIQMAPITAEKNIHNRWCSNEKTAMEAALGMSFAGKRSLVCMKHVGMNVAADCFINSAITGIKGGLIVIAADDPSMHSSQNEQDSRFYGDFSLIPMYEPSNQQEAYDMVYNGFNFSEQTGEPILMRMVTRLAHSRSGVERKEQQPQNEISFSEDPRQFILLPGNARKRYKALLQRQDEFIKASENSAYNKYTDGPNKKLGIVACGIGYNYLMTCLPNSIIMNFGDNDTFPLWYNQEVEGVRPDVRIMNTSYLDGSWYIDEMKHRYNESAPVPFSLPQHKYAMAENDFIYVEDVFQEPKPIKQVIDFIRSDAPISRIKLDEQLAVDFIPTRTLLLPVNKENAVKSGIVKPEDAHLMVDTITINLQASSLRKSEMMLLDLLANFDWERPLYVTSPSLVANFGLQDYLQFDGYAYRLVPIKTTYTDLWNAGRIDTDLLYHNLMEVYRYGNVADPRVYVDTFVNYNFNATNIRIAFARLGAELARRGEKEKAVEVLDYGLEQMPVSQFQYTYQYLPYIRAYYEARATEKGDALFDSYAKNLEEYVDYFLSFPDNRQYLIENQFADKLTALAELHRIAENYGRTDRAARILNLFDWLFGPEGQTDYTEYEQTVLPTE